MSYPNQNNPFASPVATQPMPQAGVAGYPSGIDYSRAYNYIFENPNWMTNLLWGFLCLISTAVIPVLGQLVFLGYQYELIQVLILNGGTRYPDFDINRFGDYLGRSIWPFLVGLVITIPAVFVLYIGMIIVFVIAAIAGSIGGDDVGAIFAILVGAVGVIAWIGAYAGFIAVVTPMVLRAGLQQDFAAGFDFAWVMDFVKKMWLETLLTGLFVWATGMVLVMVGMLALCVGAWVGAAAAMLAHSHLCYQLYLVYLGRGGKPIPMKPLTPMMPHAQPQH